MIYHVHTITKQAAKLVPTIICLSESNYIELEQKKHVITGH